MITGKQITALVAVLIAVILAYNSYFIVTPRERVVVVQMGEMVGANYPPGVYLKIPFIQTVYKFDRRTRALTDQIERVLTTESKNLSVTYYVKWRINNTVEYYLSTHGNAMRAEQLLKDLTTNALLAAISKRTIEQVVGGQRDELLSLVQIQVGKDAQKYGINVVDVRILKLSLPKQVSQSVYQRMRTERQEVIKTLRAEGDAAAKAIRSDARRARTEILAKAYHRAQGIKGAGDAKAAKVYAKGYQKYPEFYSFYRSLKVYRNTIGPGDLLILPPKGKLFQYFNPPVSDSGIGESNATTQTDSP